MRGSEDSSPQLQRPTPPAEDALEEKMVAEKEKLIKEKSEVVEEQKRIEQMLRQISLDISDKVCVCVRVCVCVCVSLYMRACIICVAITLN